MTMRNFFVFLSIIIFVAFGQAVAEVTAQGKTWPDIIPLPNGFQPEGVVVGHGHDIYAGSLGTGAIYRADVRTGQGELAVPSQDNRVAVGLSFDERSNLLFVAGGPAGAGYVYDTETGDTVGVYQFTEQDSFVNDVVVTRSAAYFTDSFRPFLYRVPLGPGGQLSAPSDITVIELEGDYAQVPDAFNANGIDATANGETLIIVQSVTGKLFQVNPETGHASLIDLGGGAVPNGDGLLLEGKTLYVVQNQLNQIAVVDLNASLTAGDIVTLITDSDFDVPTTIAEFGNYLYAVNARFGTPATPDTTYDIVRVNKEK
jgi:sugar lactone lactonase YvrE